MAKVVRVSPEKRLPGLLNSNRPFETYKNRITGVPKYFCPACEELTAFSVRRKTESSLPPDVKRLFDKMTKKSPYEQGVSDFRCRVCGRPVRVVYSIREFRMGAYHYDAQYVLELEDEAI